MFLKQKQVDKLAPELKIKLDRMLKEVEDNLEDLQKEKELYQKQLGGASVISKTKSGWQSHAPSIVSKFSSEPNVYSEQTAEKKRLDEINAKLL